MIDQQNIDSAGTMKLIHIATVPQTLFFLRGQLAFMRRHGFVVEAVSSPGDRLEAFGERERIQVHSCKMSREITPVGDLVSLVRLIVLLCRQRPDIVHSHTPKAGLLGMLAAFILRARVRVYHIHGLPMLTATGLRRTLLRFSDQVACRLAHQVFCVSQSIRKAAIKEGICSERHAKVIGHGSINGVDAVSCFDPTKYLGVGTREELKRSRGIPSDGLVLGFVGRIVYDKGVSELVQAWRVLRVRWPHLRLVVAGEFEEHNPLEGEMIDQLISDDRINVVGYVPPEKMPEIYAILDILAFPTHREGFGLVALEAGAMEVPVVATRIPGCVDAVEDDVSGMLVPPRDVPALVDALDRYISDAQMRRAHGVAGRARALELFSPEIIWEETLSEYRRLLGVGRESCMEKAESSNSKRL